MTATDFRTPWEAAQYAADHGAAAAIGQHLAALAAHVTAHGAADAALLGLPRLPAPAPWLIAVPGDTFADRKARVDAFAAAHGTTAGLHDPTGTYRASVLGGAMVVFAARDETVPLRERAERRKDQLLAELAAGRDARKGAAA